MGTSWVYMFLGCHFFLHIKRYPQYCTYWCILNHHLTNLITQTYNCQRINTHILKFLAAYCPYLSLNKYTTGCWNLHFCFYIITQTRAIQYLVILMGRRAVPIIYWNINLQGTCSVWYAIVYVIPPYQ